jgi:hypothetical protein
MPAKASRAAWRAARLAVYQAGVGAQVASPQSPILRSSVFTVADIVNPNQARTANATYYSAFERTGLSGFARTTTAFSLGGACSFAEYGTVIFMVHAARVAQVERSEKMHLESQSQKKQ